MQLQLNYFDFSGLPGRKNNQPPLDARLAWKSLSPKTETDDLKRSEGDNPTIGILLCSETSQDIARYSVLHGNEQLFAAKYLTYLPTEEQLRAEIEAQKEIFRLQQEQEN